MTTVESFSSDCKVCKKEVKESDSSVACNRCQDWYHLECVDLGLSGEGEAEGMKVLMNSNIFWFCPSCIKAATLAIKRSKLSAGHRVRPGFLPNILPQAGSGPRLPRKSDVVREEPLPSGIRPCDQGGIGEPIPVITNLGEDLDRSGGWRIAGIKAGKSRFRVDKKQTPQIALTNQFSCLNDMIEPTISMIGDSIIRGQGKEFCARGKNKQKRSTFCIPGANLDKIQNVISSLPDSKGSLIIHAGTNELTTKQANGRYTVNRNSEEVFNKYKVLLETLNKRERPSYLVGILPRIHIERELISRTIGINERVKNLCKGTKVTFIDLWDNFQNNDYLYSRDGLHLSRAGSALYGTLVNDIVMPLPKGLGF